jgi:hypothetical protein
MSKGYSFIGQHHAPNHGPTGLNSGQRESVKVPESVTPISSEEVHRIPGHEGANKKPGLLLP